MPLFLVLAALLSLLVSGTAADADVFAPLQREKQERLYYDDETLPGTVKALIAQDIPVTAFTAAYKAERDEKVRFNLVLILDKHVRRGAYAGADRDQAIALLRRALKSGNPWIKTEAVFALGNAKADNARADLIACLDDPSLTASYHAAVALKQTFGDLPELTDAQKGRLKAFIEAAQQEDGKNRLADKELSEYQRTDAL